MSAPRLGRFQKATALLPLALLSTAVTASFAGIGPQSALASQESPSTLPDGTTVPTDAIEAPASVSTPGVVAPGIGRGGIDRAVSSASASGIPAAALAAYQRAETVINAADRSCHLPWELLAAVGRVESDHGRVNGNTLDDDGVATPGIFGIALDGTHGTQKISDTDAGQYDADAKWDRAVGPMQFIPSTWSVVGVDGDNDGRRNPQDVDDAALASAVYLCSGRDDLSTGAGQRAAVYRYNHSNDYVDLVLSFMHAYMSGDFTSVPNAVVSTDSSGIGFFTPAPEPKQHQGKKQGQKDESTGPRGGGSDGGSTGSGDDGGVDGGVDNPVTPPDDDGGDDGDTLPDPGLPPIDPPIIGDDPASDDPVGDVVKITEEEAEQLCIDKLDLSDPLTAPAKLQQCIDDLLN